MDSISVSNEDNYNTSTRIPMSSPLYKTVRELAQGDVVRFSGKFTGDNDTCISEKSVTLNGHLDTPTFSFVYSGLALVSKKR